MLFFELYGGCIRKMETVLEYLPATIRDKIDPVPFAPFAVEEIRLRTNKPLILKIGQETQIIDYIVKQEEILQAFERICENSVYSYRRQICDGYITIRGGNRVGIVGSAVVDNGQVININYISSLNFRIARQKLGCSDSIIQDIIDEQNNSIRNTLIVSLPGCGKTTLLRDVVRNISNGIEKIGFKGKTVGVVDERGEIAAMYKGIAQNDIGIRTDVIDNMPKPEAMRILVRSMCPDVIVCDEIGSMEDIDAIDYAMCSGVKGIFTAHGKNIEEINRNPELSKLLSKHIFERIILLNPEKRGDVRCIYL
jgi:stage III sporulation protein AA